MRLHNDVLLELMLTQNIMKECSDNVSSGGHVQHLQMDPFGVHMYMDAGINILVEHLKQPAKCARTGTFSRSLNVLALLSAPLTITKLLLLTVTPLSSKMSYCGASIPVDV